MHEPRIDATFSPTPFAPPATFERPARGLRAFRRTSACLGRTTFLVAEALANEALRGTEGGSDALERAARLSFVARPRVPRGHDDLGAGRDPIPARPLRGGGAGPGSRRAVRADLRGPGDALGRLAALPPALSAHREHADHGRASPLLPADGGATRRGGRACRDARAQIRRRVTVHLGREFAPPMLVA